MQSFGIFATIATLAIAATGASVNFDEPAWNINLRVPAEPESRNWQAFGVGGRPPAEDKSPRDLSFQVTAGGPVDISSHYHNDHSVKDDHSSNKTDDHSSRKDNSKVDDSSTDKDNHVYDGSHHKTHAYHSSTDHSRFKDHHLEDKARYYHNTVDDESRFKDASRFKGHRPVVPVPIPIPSHLMHMLPHLIQLLPQLLQHLAQMFGHQSPTPGGFPGMPGGGFPHSFPGGGPMHHPQGMPLPPIPPSLIPEIIHGLTQGHGGFPPVAFPPPGAFPHAPPSGGNAFPPFPGFAGPHTGYPPTPEFEGSYPNVPDYGFSRPGAPTPKPATTAPGSADEPEEPEEPEVPEPSTEPSDSADATDATTPTASSTEPVEPVAPVDTAEPAAPETSALYGYYY